MVQTVTILIVNGSAMNNYTRTTGDVKIVFLVFPPMCPILLEVVVRCPIISLIFSQEGLESSHINWILVDLL